MILTISSELSFTQLSCSAVFYVRPASFISHVVLKCDYCSCDVAIKWSVLLHILVAFY